MDNNICIHDHVVHLDTIYWKLYLSPASCRNHGAALCWTAGMVLAESVPLVNSAVTTSHMLVQFWASHPQYGQIIVYNYIYIRTWQYAYLSRLFFASSGIRNLKWSTHIHTSGYRRYWGKTGNHQTPCYHDLKSSTFRFGVVWDWWIKCSTTVWGYRREIFVSR
jgi:hypothetical protein